MKHIKISLPTIHCESCVKVISMTLDDITGITKKTIDLTEREAQIYFDCNKVTTDTLLTVIREDAGYEVTLVSEEEVEDGLLT